MSISQWCHPTISSSDIPFSSCLQSFPASGSFPISQFFPSGGQSIGVSASASVLPINIQDWFPLGWTGWISLQSEELSSLLQHHSSKASIPWCSAFFIVTALTSMYDYWKNHNFTRRTFVGKVMSLLLNMLSRLVIAFPPRSKCLLISWLQSSSALILEPQKIKSLTISMGNWWGNSGNMADFIFHGVAKNRTRLSDWTELFPLFPHLFAMKWWDQMPWS